MRMYGRNLVAAQTANQLVRPEYRNTMAYARISRHRLKWLRQQEFPFRYNFPTEAIFATTGKVEKMSSFLIPLLIRPIDTVSLAQKINKNRWLSSIFGWGSKLFIPIIFATHTMKNSHRSQTIEHLDRFDERFDRFWEHIQDKYMVMRVRNRSFLSWRFAQVAGRVYRILVATENGDLIGYIVLRVTDEIRDIPIGLVMDLMVEPGVRGELVGKQLLDEAWKYFREEKVWITGGLALPHTNEYRALVLAGYRPLPDRIAPRVFRVAFNCFSDDLPETSQVKESDLFISIADYEAH